MKKLTNSFTTALQVIMIFFATAFTLVISGCQNETIKTGTFYVNGNTRDKVCIEKEENGYKIFSPGKWSDLAKAANGNSLINNWAYPVDYQNKKVAGLCGKQFITWNEKGGMYDVKMEPGEKKPASTVKWIPAKSIPNTADKMNDITTTLEASVGTVYLFYQDSESDEEDVDFQDESESYGSGFIDEYGNLVTCFHVIQGAVGADYDKYKLVFVPAGNESKDTLLCTRVVAFDNRQDIAVLKLEK